jgi:UDP-N-acetyl-2-amino-2-deoxyglucuronate dehydrogenase
MTSTLAVAVLGAGRAGASHARALAGIGDTELIAVFDADAARAASFAETYGCHAFTDLDALLRLPAVDLVTVALPN